MNPGSTAAPVRWATRASPEAVHAYYVKEQESMEALAKRSRMDTLVLEAEDSLEENLGKAYALWKG